MENRFRENHNTHHTGTGTGKIATGEVLICVGFILVLKNTGFLPNYFQDIIFSWQMLLIAIGFIITLGSGNRGPGLIVMAVGGFFLLPEILDVNWRLRGMFWPAIFILAGIIILSNNAWFRRGKRLSSETSPSDRIDMVNIFGGGERVISSLAFTGGRVSSVFGGAEIDLTRSSLAPGDQILDISCIFGGVSLVVPPDWNIVIDVTPILGGFSDSRKLLPGGPIDTTSTLIIRGAVIFGGGEIKSY